MKKFLSSVFGANYQTTLTAIGAAFFSALTWLSTLSYDQGPIALVIPISWKPYVVKVAGIAALVLWCWNGIAQKSKNVTGGTQQQDSDGAVVPESRAELVHITKKARK